MEALHVTIAKELGVKPHQVEAAIKLLDEGNTVPFIARYRKEMTGELKDEELRQVEDRMAYLRNLEDRRSDIIRTIEEQGKMTDELMEALLKAEKLQALEDLYLPFKQKKRTRGSVARERGLEGLAELMLMQKDTVDVLQVASEYVTEDVPTAEDAIQGASDIIAEDVSNRADVRQYLRDSIHREGAIKLTLSDDEELAQGFLAYGDGEAKPIRLIQPHQVLAINRGEKLGALKVNFEVPQDKYIAHLYGMMKQVNNSWSTYVVHAVEDGYKRLLFPSIERDVRNALTEKAEEQAIRVFATNLRNLLLQAPLRGHVIMGLDPGYRTGCKMAIIDTKGDVLDYGAYYVAAGSDHQKAKAHQELANKIRHHGVTLISIGNGTASYETEQFISNLIAEENLDCHYLITNEAGASVYSASKLAIEELPDLDVTIRGAVSIARRVQDPLAEAVKIDPKSIGVGQYQHDVNQKELSHTLDQVVESVVNHVGVELNTASPAILAHVAGISSTVANNIAKYRKENGTFTSRKELLKVARLGPAAFTQCAGFLRIEGAKNALDNTSVHPESYELAKSLIEDMGFTLDDLSHKDKRDSVKSALMKVRPEMVAAKLEAGVPTVRDIVEALLKPGRDPREDLPAPLTRKSIMSLADMKVGTKLKGTVHNVVDFGAFIDIGIKVNGLLHRSQFCRRNQHPSEVLAVGDVIDVEIISVEEKRNRIGLTLIKPKK